MMENRVINGKHMVLDKNDTGIFRQTLEVLDSHKYAFSEMLWTQKKNSMRNLFFGPWGVLGV